ncbi:beta-ketoacyl-acyl-carrier-protein synthase I [Powellomyces hirtus]|nr:beta-ketoacyl-acyl-carrier-protein synthase I [Powellomyces hirtus]
MSSSPAVERTAAIAGHLSNPKAAEPVAPLHRIARDVELPMEIKGVGRFLPPNIVTTESLELEHGWPKGLVKEKLGVTQRYRADKHMTASWMGAKAGHEALKHAGMTGNDLDLILNASAIPERLIPDAGPLIQMHMGLSETHIPCFSVHATCMSFPLAFQTAASFIASGVYRNILIVSSEKLEGHLNFEDIPSSALFGDCAVACIVGPPEEGSSAALHRVMMETDGRMHNLATLHKNSKGFKMQGPELMNWSHNNLPLGLEVFMPGMTNGLPDDVTCVIAHQASAKGLKVIRKKFGWGDKVIDVFQDCGNTVASSIPNALYQAIQTGALKRGDKAILAGTGAGLSFIVMSFTY